MNGVLQYPGVVCGHLQTSLDAFLFARINAGNVISLALNQGWGWAGEENLRLLFDQLFTDEQGQGFPAASPGASTRFAGAAAAHLRAGSSTHGRDRRGVARRRSCCRPSRTQQRPRRWTSRRSRTPPSLGAPGATGRRARLTSAGASTSARASSVPCRPRPGPADHRPADPPTDLSDPTDLVRPDQPGQMSAHGALRALDGRPGPRVCPSAAPSQRGSCPSVAVAHGRWPPAGPAARVVLQRASSDQDPRGAPRRQRRLRVRGRHARHPSPSAPSGALAPPAAATASTTDARGYSTSAGRTTRSSRAETCAASAVESTSRCWAAVSSELRPSRTASMKSRVARTKLVSHSAGRSS